MSKPDRIEYRVSAEDYCEEHQKKHSVAGHTTNKKSVGILKNDLVVILREDYPDCKLQPKPSLDTIFHGYKTVDENGLTHWEHREAM